MKRRSGRKTKAARPRKAAAKPRPKARAASPASRGKAYETAAQLKRELAEALRRESATGEVLKVIAGSSGDLKPVFQAMLESAVRLCEAKFGILFRFEDRIVQAVAELNIPAALQKFIARSGRHTPIPGTSLDLIWKSKQTIHTLDDRQSAAPTPAATLGGARTYLCVPLLSDGKLVGAITIYRQEVRPFADKQIELVQSFAAQAVIAIENARLLNELRQRTDDLTESLEQQTATSEVLKVISSSPSQLEPVFETMLANAVRVCGAGFGTMHRYDGNAFHFVAGFQLPAQAAEFQKRRGPFQPQPGSINERVFRTKQVVHSIDYAAEAAPGYAATLGGARSTVAVPMLRDGRLLGTIIIFRQEVRPFTGKQIELVQSFAAQAVIAIENARLLGEQRESLQQQTATADVLKVISRSTFDLQAVLDTLVQSAARLCEADQANIARPDDGGQFHIAATHGLSPEHASDQKALRFKPESGSLIGRVLLERAPVHIEDAATDPAYTLALARTIGGFHSMMGVPLMREGVPIGVFGVTRKTVRPFSERQVELLTTFADQAVIAIENARLLNELRGSLARQTATSDVLEIISTTPGELQPVFDSILENATRLCEANFGGLVRYTNGMLHPTASVNYPQALAEFVEKRGAFLPVAGTALDRAFKTKEVVHIADDAAEAIPTVVTRLGGARSYIAVPMVKDDELIGIILIYRQEVRPFTDEQIELVQNFAAQAVIAIENARLLGELRQRTDDLTESLEQQTASSEVLDVISNSLVDTQPVFDAIVRSGLKLFADAAIVIMLPQGDQAVIAAIADNDPVRAEGLKRRSPIPLRREYMHSLAIIDGKTVDVPDVNNPPPDLKSGAQNFRAGGFNAVTIVPMMRGGVAIGALSVARVAPGPLSSKQHGLLETFAAQAVIAIENTRLLGELRQRTDDLSEALEQQTATSEVLKVISSSPGELNPVFAALLENATRICDAKFGAMFKIEDRCLALESVMGMPPPLADYLRQRQKFRPLPGSTLERLIETKGAVHVEDVAATDGLASPSARLGGARSYLAVPMLRDADMVGAIAIYRQEMRPFTDKQIALVQTFADQAVIAIENARLLNELRARTDDLSEALEQQTATSEVLKVISSSPGDLQPVFQAMLENAMRICEAKFGIMFEYIGGAFRALSTLGVPPAFSEFHRDLRVWGPDTGLGRLALSKQTVHVHDTREWRAYLEKDEGRMAAVEIGGVRSFVAVPMLKEGELIGAIIIFRQEVRPFSDKQIELVTNFAAQAVIAIENARLLGELRQRTDDLSEALEQQTATSEVLKVISSSPGELEPVFQAMLRNATQICEAKIGILFRYDDGSYTAVSKLGVTAEYAAFLDRGPIRPGATTGLGRVASSLQTVHIEDTKAEQAYADREPFRVATAELGRARSLLNVPMLKDGKLIGAIGVYRQQVRPFTNKQIELVSNFAAQAVIAIENARLLGELRESLQQQTATADVLKTISRSTFDLRVVLNTLVESASKLCEADMAQILRPRGEGCYSAASYGYSAEYDKYLEALTFAPGRGSVTGRTLLERKTVQIPDVLADPEYSLPDVQRVGGFRTHLGVPMFREGSLIGVLIVSRRTVRPFDEKQIELIETFADQAVIAIENVRLFDEIQEKSRQLAEASQHKSQFLANMSHELRTPLNAILGYTELILDGIYGETPQKALDVLKRVESNGKHLLGLINDVLDFSKIEAGEMRLALDGYSIKDVVHNVYSVAEPLAAKKNLTLKMALPPDVPAARGDERKLTQVLLNLVGNAIKFTDTGEVAIEVAANNGSLSVAVRDTGPGIAPQDHEKLFEEFQQADNSITKAKGGTGLGLAIARRIVEMHGGRLSVDSSLGRGATFTFTIPAVVERQARLP